MGTNYHAIPKISKESEKQFRDLAEAGSWDELQKQLNEKNIEVHIGKSSGGWKFIFNHNKGKYFGRTRESIDAFLRQSELRDEYWREVSIGDFWGLVDSKIQGRMHSYAFEENGLVFSESTDFS